MNSPHASRASSPTNLPPQDPSVLLVAPLSPGATSALLQPIDLQRILQIIDGTVTEITVGELQMLIGQLSAYNQFEDQINRTIKDVVNSIHDRMAREEGDTSSAWTQGLAASSMNPFRQNKIILQILMRKLQVSCPHFNIETLTGSLSKEKTIIYKTSNFNVQGGSMLLVSNQQAPTLSEYSVTNVRTFANRVKHQHASGMNCNISAMIPLGNTRQELMYSLQLKKLLSSPSEFEHILANPILFLSTMDKFLKILNIPIGTQTDTEIIRAKLLFSLDNILDEKQVSQVINAIAKFDYECNDVFLNAMNEDQTELIKVLIEQNNQKHLSKAQRKLFALVKVHQSRFDSVKACCECIISNISGAVDICNHAFAFGMSYNKSTNSQENDSRESKATEPVYKSKLFQKHWGGTASGGGKSLSSSSSKQDKKNTAKKSESYYGPTEDKVCTVCGIKGHLGDSCN